MNRNSKRKQSLEQVLESIGQRLIELRITKGYKSYAEFAHEFDLPPIQYWRMEKGRANVTLKSLYKVASVHGLSVEDLFIMALYHGKNGAIRVA